jgi:hypothetical protein
MLVKRVYHSTATSSVGGKGEVGVFVLFTDGFESLGLYAGLSMIVSLAFCGVKEK